jgi:hypothetical protein
MSLTNTELLIKLFGETVESRIDTGDILGVNDETLDKLRDSLRVAISIASNRNRRELLERKPLASTLPEACNDVSMSENPSQSQLDGQTALSSFAPNTLPNAISSAPIGGQQHVEGHDLNAAATSTGVLPTTQSQFLQLISGGASTPLLSGEWPDFGSEAWVDMTESPTDLLGFSLLSPP